MPCPPPDSTIVATGPLTAAALAQSIVAATGQDRLAFFDAIAPIVHFDSIDMDICWMPSRWNKVDSAGGDGKDYINCPMTREQYLAFHQGLLDGEKGEFKEWEARHALFRWLHADRGDGRARCRHAALWPDETGRTRQSA